MLEPIATTTKRTHENDWLTLAQSLGKQFIDSEQTADASDQFVADNFVALKESGLSAAGIPTELGGGGASYAEVCQILQILGYYCSSTALAFSMHTHQVMVAAWKWHHQNAPVEGLLKRIAQEQIILLSSGGSDWLDGSGTATPTEGGFIINGRKVFSSGAPAGDLLLTSAVDDDPSDGATVLHFAVPMNTTGVSIQPTWQAMGMRGTGSHDILLSDVFIPESAITLRRPAGKWHPAFHLIAMVALPIIYSVYVGIAEAARDLAVEHAQKNRHQEQVCYQVGGLENELMAARLAIEHIISTAASSEPNFDTTNQIISGCTLVTRAILNVIDLSMEIAGGRAFHRPFGLEKLFRDAQGVRYHPMREPAQRKLTGQLALSVPHDQL
ncbi:MAG: acyl-CoA dehydrogenase [Cyanobacteria bacterium]|jgi:alkylation response protein AidB-like acyl-CoA dehydrogenase|nr:acyl-CoA dehydrogenase [Cyanobacteria bacterium GSL.Bin1]